MRAIWKGAISFGMITIPVKLYTATEEKDVRLRMLCKEHRSPIQEKRFCREGGAALDLPEGADAKVRGKERQPGRADAACAARMTEARRPRQPRKRGVGAPHERPAKTRRRLEALLPVADLVTPDASFAALGGAGLTADDGRRRRVLLHPVGGVVRRQPVDGRVPALALGEVRRAALGQLQAGLPDSARLRGCLPGLVVRDASALGRPGHLAMLPRHERLAGGLRGELAGGACQTATDVPAFGHWGVPASTSPRHAPVSTPRLSMNFLNRSRSPFTRRSRKPSAVPTSSTMPSGSASS